MTAWEPFYCSSGKVALVVVTVYNPVSAGSDADVMIIQLRKGTPTDSKDG